MKKLLKRFNTFHYIALFLSIFVGIISGLNQETGYLFLIFYILGLFVFFFAALGENYYEIHKDKHEDGKVMYYDPDDFEYK